jgi:DNA-binding response OmpR family regulator
MNTILLHESDADILDIVSTALEMQGYHVCSLGDQPENALEIVKRHRAKLILLDCWVNKNSGKLCQWIKSHFPRVHVVAFSSDPGIGQCFRSLGFDDYLPKPFDLDELYAMVKKFSPAGKAHRKTPTQMSC